MRLLSSTIFIIFFILEYVKEKKVYLLLGAFISFFSIILGIPYINNIAESYHLVFKYGVLGLIIPFMYLFVKDKFLLFRDLLR